MRGAAVATKSGSESGSKGARDKTSSPTRSDGSRPAPRWALGAIRASAAVDAERAPVEAEAHAVADRVESSAGPPSEAKFGVPLGVSRPVPASPISGGVGRRLSPSERGYFEPRMGYDFSSVRMHDGPAGHRAAQGVGARAATVGPHVAMSPSSSGADDRKVMAHELAHVVQQGHARPLAGFGDPIRRRESPTLRLWPLVDPTPAQTSHTPATIRAMELGDFISLTETQLDWATSSALQADPGELAKFRQLEDFGGEPFIAESCSGMSVDDILNEGLPGAFRLLRDYARAAVSDTTVWIRVTDTFADARDQARDLHHLETLAVMGLGPDAKATLSMVMGAPDPVSDPSPFEKLRATGRLMSFAAYLLVCKPTLSATNGAEIDSYLDWLDEGGLPFAFIGRINLAKTFHHFTNDTLEAMAANEAYTQAAWLPRALTVFLYPTVDHNGAFHRNEGLQRMVEDQTILTIVIEGHATVGDYASALPAVAARYGVDGEIAQALIGGHGSADGLDLAGATSGDQVNSEDITTHGAGEARTRALMAQLTSLMNSDPAQRRIVLDACLTNSNDVAHALRASPADAAADVMSQIAGNPNLRSFVETLAGAGSTVIGSNSSFAPADTQFLGPGVFDDEAGLSTPPDPALGDSKLVYVEFGTEPMGAMRAALEAWADDQLAGTTDTVDAMNRRIAAGRSTRASVVYTWSEGIIQALYSAVVGRYSGNGEAIRRLGQLAGAADELYWPDFTTPGHLRHSLGPLAGDQPNRDALFGHMVSDGAATTNPRIPVVVQQAWMQVDHGQRGAFASALAGFSNCGDAEDHVDMTMVLPHTAGMLPATAPASPPQGDLMVALMAAIVQPLASPVQRHIAYLRQLRGSGPDFPAALAIDDRLGTYATEGEVLTAIGFPRSGGGGGGGGGSGTPDPANIDVDRDGSAQNDFRVEPFRARGEVKSKKSLRVRERPSTRERILDHLPTGTKVRIVGRYGNWYAIERPGDVAFVWGPAVKILP